MADLPADHGFAVDGVSADDGGSDVAVGGELEPAVAERIDPDRYSGSDVLDEQFIAGVFVHPQHAVVEEDREVRAVELVLVVRVLPFDFGDDFGIGGHKFLLCSVSF